MKYLGVILLTAMLLTACGKTPPKVEKVDCNNLQAVLKGKSLAEQQAINDQCFRQFSIKKSDPLVLSIK